MVEERLDLTTQGQVRYRLKKAYRDGTTHIVLEPLDFIARLAALVPPPRAHTSRGSTGCSPRTQHSARRSRRRGEGRGRERGLRPQSGLDLRTFA